MLTRAVSVVMCVTDSAEWDGALTSYEHMFAIFAILSCVSSQGQHGGRSAGTDLGRGLAAIVADDIDRKHIDEQTNSPHQGRKR
jgi:hypothetical protein